MLFVCYCYCLAHTVIIYYLIHKEKYDEEDKEDKEKDGTTVGTVDTKTKQPEDRSGKSYNEAPEGNLMDATDKEAVEEFEKGIWPTIGLKQTVYVCSKFCQSIILIGKSIDRLLHCKQCTLA